MTILLTRTQLDSLRRRSRETGASISELVRRAVDVFLAEQDDHEALCRRALSVCGRFRSDTGDVSERHSEYFVDGVIGMQGRTSQ